MSLVFFFYRLQSSTLDLLEMELCNNFHLLYMKLSPSHDAGDEFNMLAWVDLDFFLISSLILGQLEIEFHSFFYLLSIKLSRPHDPSYKFGRLIWVDSGSFFYPFFNLIFSFNLIF